MRVLLELKNSNTKAARQPGKGRGGPPAGRRRRAAARAAARHVRSATGIARCSNTLLPAGKPPARGSEGLGGKALALTLRGQPLALDSWL